MPLDCYTSYNLEALLHQRYNTRVIAFNFDRIAGIGVFKLQRWTKHSPVIAFDGRREMKFISRADVNPFPFHFSSGPSGFSSIAVRCCSKPPSLCSRSNLPRVYPPKSSPEISAYRQESGISRHPSESKPWPAVYFLRHQGARRLRHSQTEPWSSPICHPPRSRLAQIIAGGNGGIFTSTKGDMQFFAIITVAVLDALEQHYPPINRICRLHR